MRHADRRRARARAGFTVVEIVIGATLLALVLGNLYLLLGRSSRDIDARAPQLEAEIEVRRVLDRIAMSVIGAESATVAVAQSAPNSANQLDYAVSLGFDASQGQALWSPGRRIAHDGAAQVAWSENPGEPSERRATWTRHAAPYLEGETANGIDDNGNGLIDERGLSFEVEGKMVVIRLTVSLPSRTGGELVTRTLETRVTCRN